jgi:hypothetical protein
MEIQTQASLYINAPREKLFTFATTSKNLPKVFTGFGPVPAIKKVSMIEGQEGIKGSVRLVENSDGSKIRERILKFTPPKNHSYVLESGFIPPFSWIVSKAIGNWTFDSEKSGVRVTWKFTFFLTTPIAIAVALPLAKVFFYGAQLKCLRNIKAACEK